MLLELVMFEADGLVELGVLLELGVLELGELPPD
jgi:hypothetical protein